MRIEWDESKRASNLRRHGVDFADAVGALVDPRNLTREDEDPRFEKRFITLGRGYSDRLLLVVWTERGEDVTRIISARKASPGEARAYKDGVMRKEYDFGEAKQAKDVPHLKKLQSDNAGKERITIRLDAEILNWFREQVKGGGNYQTLINEALHAHIAEREGALERTLRRVLREELKERAA